MGLSETLARMKARGLAPNLLPSVEISEGEALSLDLKGPFLYAPARCVYCVHMSNEKETWKPESGPRKRAAAWYVERDP